MVEYSARTKQKSETDEWFTPPTAIEPLMPYIKKYKTIWCPFDRYDDEIQSMYVKVLRKHGHDVIFSHIDYGQDFFRYLPDRRFDAIISNPPYSLRNDVFKRLYEINKPFGMLMNYAGLFDNRYRFNLFKEKGVQLFVLNGRTNFIKRGRSVQANSPLFQAIYICRGILPNQIVFQ